MTEISYVVKGCQVFNIDCFVVFVDARGFELQQDKLSKVVIKKFMRHQTVYDDNIVFCQRMYSTADTHRECSAKNIYDLDLVVDVGDRN